MRAVVACACIHSLISSHDTHNTGDKGAEHTEQMQVESNPTFVWSTSSSQVGVFACFCAVCVFLCVCLCVCVKVCVALTANKSSIAEQTHITSRRCVPPPSWQSKTKSPANTQTHTHTHTLTLTLTLHLTDVCRRPAGRQRQKPQQWLRPHQQSQQHLHQRIGPQHCTPTPFFSSSPTKCTHPSLSLTPSAYTLQHTLTRGAQHTLACRA